MYVLPRKQMKPLLVSESHSTMANVLFIGDRYTNKICLTWIRYLRLYYYHCFDTSASGLLVIDGFLLPVVSVTSLTWFVRYIRNIGRKLKTQEGFQSLLIKERNLRMFLFQSQFFIPQINLANLNTVSNTIDYIGNA